MSLLFKNPNGNWFSLIESPYSESWITPWSFIHFMWGVIYAIFMLSFQFNYKSVILIGFLIHSVYEFKDYHYSYNRNDSTFKFNSVRNILGDTISFLFGIYICINYIRILPINLQLSLLIVIFTLIIISLNKWG
jgi:hypothetical protein